MLSPENISALLDRLDEMADLEGALSKSPGLVSRYAIPGRPDEHTRDWAMVHRRYGIEYLDAAASENRGAALLPGTFSDHPLLRLEFAGNFNGQRFTAKVAKIEMRTFGHDATKETSVLVVDLTWQISTRVLAQ